MSTSSSYTSSAPAEGAGQNKQHGQERGFLGVFGHWPVGKGVDARKSPLKVSATSFGDDLTRGGGGASIHGGLCGP
jgi:hypothetical protein